MEKNKRDLMILIALLFVGINYASYTYFIKAQLNSVEQAKNKYITRKKELSSIKLKQQSIHTKEKEIEKLKQETADFDSMVPVKVDTPKLIYDFYNGCKSSGVTGQSISFELLNEEDNSGDENSNNASNTTDNKDSTTSQNNQDSGKFYTLSINLKVTGNKSNIENFIKGLKTITERKLNVKSITISTQNSITSGSSNNGTDTRNLFPESNSSGLEENVNNNQTGEGSTQTSQELLSEIVFYEYIQDSGNGGGNLQENYGFYDSEREGFNSISDMFK
ncbi:hypothetical protein [Clostridium kluyveri]|uniref:Pilus assembly protein PilO n=2 Tax=Clostridium kluyveri TaxID=1534 RepID=A5N777_CLOK5|nr:hypothetical protein [Clostridium kluyveri]EDK33158.1 Conserved hypothetical protein [Clostridium kluyveri DSM 555]BAH06067.1 hypothetical protein CKR_1016 [Clostridium kluyveri NBRC 12016]